MRIQRPRKQLKNTSLKVSWRTTPSENKHVKNFSLKKSTEQTQKFYTNRQKKFQIWKTTNATTSNNFTLWKKVNVVSICQLWVISKWQFCLNKTSWTLSRQSDLKKDHRPSSKTCANFSNLVGKFLELIQFCMTAKHKIQWIILLWFATNASNKTMTSPKKSFIGGKHRQYRWNQKANRMIQRFCSQQDT